ncbi:hypothetical protein BD780_000223 [Clostridium tetanomorphum]|uniref:hypothetical protein n=1 Tax=Clostridium tetanomorphum TaxID=1553 RepID=UPI0004531822|nr:hypothetical protein [Clostridium tetanomorphum]KAJ51101.1 hypothetical protein CTM_14483 [Clostridium tetanomorphum DSM 665]MBP1864471.1 hypothetical protein [Clostridium tetanomorphum]NRS82998.1 hypothetical protein [Clostridium tetanomorphum]NRZ98906.1 hypothetical protein [Clostridium tetanomorphum]SQC01036.1 Uncharacterised protein [Clostridium tetanomorphum]
MYPKEIDKFNDKLDKINGNTYSIEEEVTLTDGIYEEELKHGNVISSSVRVFTASKLTGEKIENFILSTPSNAPWKKIIKIFSKTSKVYITYETQGDTVEAEDINIVQQSIANTQKEIDRYKDFNDLEVRNLKNTTNLLEKSKSDKTYVDTELLKKADKDNIFTKEEVLQKINNLIGTAPETLDTFKEIADALGNDPNFAATIMNLLSSKVDKIQGKNLSSEDYTLLEKRKLAAIQDNANNYIHPSTHPSSMITGLHYVAFSGDYNSLRNKPTSLPPAQHNHDDTYMKKGSVTWNNLKGV